jgi:periplasmic divalent cation tolerance protein
VAAPPHRARGAFKTPGEHQGRRHAAYAYSGLLVFPQSKGVPMAGHIQALTTIDSREAAVAVADAVVLARVAACAQIVGPIFSTYWWQGQVERAEEWQVLMKTTAERYPDLERVVRAAHSYDVPEIIATPIVSASADYISWIDAETAPPH